MALVGGSPAAINAFLTQAARNRARTDDRDNWLRDIITGVGTGFGKGVAQGAEQGFRSQELEADRAFTRDMYDTRQRDALAEQAAQRMRDQSGASAAAGALGLDPSKLQNIPASMLSMVMREMLGEVEAGQTASLLRPMAGTPSIPNLGAAVAGIPSPPVPGIPSGAPATTPMVAQRAPFIPNLRQGALEGAMKLAPKPVIPKAPPLSPYDRRAGELRAEKEFGAGDFKPPKQEEPKETLDEKIARLEAEAAARARGTATGTPAKAPKPDTRDSLEKLRDRITDPQDRITFDAAVEFAKEVGKLSGDGEATVARLIAKYPEAGAASAPDAGPTQAELAEMDAAGMKWDPVNKKVVPK